MHKILLLLLWGISDVFSMNKSFNHERAIYDYVIVGGGTAGCVLANRLSEDSHINVLLLEAGPSDLVDQNPVQPLPPHLMTSVPQLSIPIPSMFPLMQGSSIDWKFKTEPQKYAAKENINRESLWPQGKVLGGSSSLNAMKMSRGSRHDYDLWEELGNEGWGYKDILPYFKKLEKVQDPRLLPTNREHSRGTNGVLPIVQTRATPLADLFVNSGAEMGYDVTDPNDQEMLGVSYVQHNTLKGKRQSTAEAYLRPVLSRDNLVVITGARVTKIFVENNKAQKVLFKKDGYDRLARTKKEIILSAGAIMSPFILLHSGIGPKEHLTEMEIEPVVDLPVGNGLEDHVFTMINFAINDSSMTLCPSNTQNLQSAAEYLIFGSGKWATTGTQGAAYMQSDTQPKSEKFPNLELFLTSCLVGSDDQSANMWKLMTGADSQMYDSFHLPERNVPGFMILPTLLHPKSPKGTIRLRDDDPFSTPEIKLDYLEHRDDVKDFIQAIRLTQELVNMKSFQSVNATYVNGKHPGCVDYIFDTDEYWECFVKHRTLTDYHYSGTCRMGPEDSLLGVVDNRLRVKGIKNLRVVDASVIPHQISGNTMLPVIMIAEKATDMIKEDRRQKRKQQRIRSKINIKVN